MDHGTAGPDTFAQLESVIVSFGGGRKRPLLRSGFRTPSKPGLAVREFKQKVAIAALSHEASFHR
jgi:hypothetical protein